MHMHLIIVLLVNTIYGSLTIHAINLVILLCSMIMIHFHVLINVQVIHLLIKAFVFDVNKSVLLVLHNRNVLHVRYNFGFIKEIAFQIVPVDTYKIINQGKC